jgi:putative PIG3 family NAD(P)H quinone oxidoreductase
VRAIVISRPGDADVLEERDVPRPEPGPADIRVRVAATAVNRADLSQRRGRYPAPEGWPADIPGLEYAGTVEARGRDAHAWRHGDRVMGLVGGGSYAEYVCVHEAEAIAVPANMALEDAAAIPEAFMTAHDALLTQAGLRAGETLLIHGAGSGVGTAAIQIGKAVGARVIGTARTERKLDRAAALGLDVKVNTSTVDFVEVVQDATRGLGADVILDLVGGDYLVGNLRVLALHGRIMQVGVSAGARAELDMRTLMGRRGTIRGTVLRARSHEEKVAVARVFADFALPLFESGALKPVIDTRLPLAQAADAHRLMEANTNFGKIVLTV